MSYCRCISGNWPSHLTCLHSYVQDTSVHVFILTKHMLYCVARCCIWQESHSNGSFAHLKSSLLLFLSSHLCFYPLFTIALSFLLTHSSPLPCPWFHLIVTLSLSLLSLSPPPLPSLPRCAHVVEVPKTTQVCPVVCSTHLRRHAQDYRRIPRGKCK